MAQQKAINNKAKVNALYFAALRKGYAQAQKDAADQELRCATYEAQKALAALNSDIELTISFRS
jgi:hypothetical protein